jgi:hypothetical protein
MNGMIGYSSVVTTISSYIHNLTITITQEITSSMFVNTSTIQLPSEFLLVKLSIQLSWTPCV